MARLPKDLGVTFCIYTDLEEIWALVKEKSGNQDNAGPRGRPKPHPYPDNNAHQALDTPNCHAQNSVSGKDT